MVEETLRREGNTGPAQFSNHVLPGGKSYREKLLTLPRKALPKTM